MCPEARNRAEHDGHEVLLLHDVRQGVACKCATCNISTTRVSCIIATTKMLKNIIYILSGIIYIELSTFNLVKNDNNISTSALGSRL